MMRAHRHGPRRSPPHDVEVEAIQHQTTQILHKIHIGPDGDLVEIFNIDSSTRAGDLCKKIASHLDMKNHLGFSLFVHIQDKTISIKEDQFIFDFIRQLTDVMKRSKNESFDYEIFFMRKLWVHFKPGADSIADEFYNFTSEKDLGKMGALIFISQFGQDKEMMKLLNK